MKNKLLIVLLIAMCFVAIGNNIKDIVQIKADIVASAKNATKASKQDLLKAKKALAKGKK